MKLNKLCLCLRLHFSVIAARNEVGARLCFYTCLWFCSRGVCPIVWWDSPPPDQASTPGPGTPESRHPPPQCMLGDKGNKQAVCILLQYSLVGKMVIPLFTISLIRLMVILENRKIWQITVLQIRENCKRWNYQSVDYTQTQTQTQTELARGHI